MIKSQLELTSEISNYLRESEYYVSMMLGRFAEQDFTNAYYQTDDIVKFLALVFLVKPNLAGHKILSVNDKKVKFYKSVYVPIKDDEKLTDEEWSRVQEQLSERDQRIASKVICNIERVARRMVTDTDSSSMAADTFRSVSIFTYAKHILTTMLDVLKNDLDVTPEGREQLERIRLILSGREI